MAYRTILTQYGLAKLAAATAAGEPINLVEMAVGDGNGNPVTPVESQTQLVGERFRAPLNRVYQDPGEAVKFITELIIPAAVGGFVVREAGVFDDAGGLFAVANTPDTYKPTPDEGAFSDAAVRLAFIASNATVITLQVDPNVAVATHQWVINNITAAQLIPGGTTGQYLAKTSNADGDYAWVDPGVTNVVVDTIEEPQTLAASQTVVTWNVVTTRGLAVYIEGVRLVKGATADQWLEDPTNPDFRIILGKSYPAGTQIVGAQNEPTGSVPFPLIRSENLADVPDKAAARANLGVYSKAETDQKAPVSKVSYFAGSVAPAGWLKCNGAAVSRTAYADLFAVVGTMYGAGNGSTTFNLPDLRGEFIRGWDDGRGIDSGRAFGSGQSFLVESHAHAGTTNSSGSHIHSGSANSAGAHSHSIPPVRGVGIGGVTNSQGQEPVSSIGSTDAAGAHTHSLTIQSAGSHSHGFVTAATGGIETRPRNIALLPCIKF